MSQLGITFNDQFHTLRDWGLRWAHKDIQPPEVITRYIDIPGRKTKIDATESLYGHPTYENRLLTFEFEADCNARNGQYLDSKIQRAIGGKRCKVVLDIEPDKYWMGRVTVESRYDSENPVIVFFTITVDAEPYKYWAEDPKSDWEWDPFNFVDGCIQGLQNLTVSGTLNQQVYGKEMGVYPVIFCSSAMKVSINGKSYDLKAGENRLEEVFLEFKLYNFVFTGNGTVSIGLRGETL